MIIAAAAFAVVEHFLGPRDAKAPQTETSSQPSPETIRAREERALKTEQLRGEAIKQAKERNARLKNAEIERVNREKEVLLKDLRAVAEAYPATPEIHQRRYQAGQRIQEIEHQYALKNDAIRNKYEALSGQDVDAIQKATEAELANLHAGTITADPEPEIPRANVISPPNPPLKPFLESPRPSSETSYSVTGIARNDVLNVRSGPGANYEIVAKLENERSGLRIVGPAVMNGTTEWVPIAVEDRTGWVTKAYLKAE